MNYNDFIIKMIIIKNNNEINNKNKGKKKKKKTHPAVNGLKRSSGGRID